MRNTDCDDPCRTLAHHRTPGNRQDRHIVNHLAVVMARRYNKVTDCIVQSIISRLPGAAIDVSEQFAGRMPE